MFLAPSEIRKWNYREQRRTQLTNRKERMIRIEKMKPRLIIDDQNESTLVTTSKISFILKCQTRHL
jgi:DNA/RNA-binding domain of Phe-tRNA-synthetase-like protein